MKESRVTKDSFHTNRKDVSLHQILEEIRTNEDFIAPRSHNMLVYNDLKSFEKFYGECAAKWLPSGDIVLIATQYQTFDTVERALRKSGVDVTKHMDEGTLKIIDAQHGYLPNDVYGTWKLAMSLIQRVKQEGRPGLSWIGDMGSFIGFHRVEGLMEYELSFSKDFDDALRTVCCYHEGDFRRLSTENQDILLNHHFKSVTIH